MQLKTKSQRTRSYLTVMYGASLNPRWVPKHLKKKAGWTWNQSTEKSTSTLSLLQGLLLHGVKKAVRLSFATLHSQWIFTVISCHHIYFQIDFQWVWVKLSASKAQPFCWTPSPPDLQPLNPAWYCPGRAINLQPLYLRQDGRYSISIVAPDDPFGWWAWWAYSRNSCMFGSAQAYCQV